MKSRTVCSLTGNSHVRLLSAVNTLKSCQALLYRFMDDALNALPISICAVSMISGLMVGLGMALDPCRRVGAVL